MLTIGVITIICLVITWWVHPLNPHADKWKRKQEFKYYASIEKQWRAYKQSPSMPENHTQRRVLKMGEWEFEEWLVSIWVKSSYWYEIRLTAFLKWDEEKRFDILKNPSPTDSEMEKVIYLPSMKSRA